MKNRRELWLDYSLCLVIMLLAISIAVYSSRFNQDDLVINITLLVLLFIVSGISLMRSAVIGLIVSMFVIVMYGGIIVYQSFIGMEMLRLSYVWIIAFPVFALVLGIAGERIRRKERDVCELQELHDRLVTRDELTGFSNTKEFYTELQEEMYKAHRHKTPFSLMVVEIQYFDELLAIYGKNSYSKILGLLTDAFNKELRLEDKRYRTGEKSFAFILAHTPKGGAEVLGERIKTTLTNLTTFEQGKGVESYKIQIRVGICEYDQSIDSNLAFKKKADKELEYDV